MSPSSSSHPGGQRGKPITAGPAGSEVRAALSSSFKSGSPVAEALARDIAECSDDDLGDPAIDTNADIPRRGSHSLSKRRASAVAYGVSRPIVSDRAGEDAPVTDLDRRQSRDAERSLLRDNHILPPKHKHHSDSFFARLYRSLFSTKLPIGHDENGNHPPTERSPLLNGLSRASSTTDSDDLEEQWEEAVTSGRIRTTWQRETKTLVQYSVPLIMTFMLQYSINVASIFAVGHIGKIELGAVSLANMSQGITCLAPFQGLATSLDTLCAQAYGSGHKHLVGLQCQRMAVFLLTLSGPVIILWCYSEAILLRLVPDAETARLASLYLKIIIPSIPGMILFECGKRFTQAQGLFNATTYVLIIAAPINIFVNWFLVWHLKLGYIGAPIAVAFTESLLPILLFLYVFFVKGRECWGGFSKRAFSNWGIMVKLALPGMIMVEAEWLAFEIMTLLSSRFGSEYLAAQSVLATLATITYNIPFPMSIASSTRVANLIGAGLVDAAKIAAKVTFALSILVGLTNLTIFSSLRFHLPLLFTNDKDVIAIVAKALPVVAFTQVFDGLASGAHGLLRGIGRQTIGGPANLISYYVISLPVSLGLAFGLDWKLDGLWLGVAVGLICVATFEYTYLAVTDWHQASAEAADRNESG